ncbi:hypothetical protein OX284_010360 [Flavobacterium sp. SUN046]|uniref:hypothetical protein n=1 Tax=Flavobacterium sp. SUN046 TaxID=3002440 RepID=UPI002DBCDFB1|nr:hypothetical protein [Flavobacterium sp. SUN046]MEC4049831.1 hypothetical protein [Flavobacterium sp. SUN046]
MKYFTILFITTSLTLFVSCQNKLVKTIYTSTKKVTATKLNASKIYVLQQITDNADFDYSKLEDLDASIHDVHSKNLMPIFEPVSGTYRYYQFLSSFIGQAYNDVGPPLFQEFHDVLIVKTDRSNTIIDAYQYTLEWAEPPYQYDLYKSSAQNIPLVDDLSLSKLKFKRTYNWRKEDDELLEGGEIQLKRE